MAIDININNQNKHWVLVILDKIKNVILAIWEVIVKILKTVGRFIKRIWKILVGLAALVIIVTAAIWGYDYYTNTYIPQKLLDEAVADIESKFNSTNDSIKLEYALNILKTDYTWSYDRVSDNDIRSKLSSHIDGAFKYVEDKAYAGNARCQFALGQLYFHDNDYVENNNTKAAYWWNEAAQQGYIKAFNSVGLAYKDGIGVNADQKLAIEWLKRGAEAGDDHAQCNYGNLFRDEVKIRVGSHKRLKPGYNPAIYNRYDLYAWENIPEYEILIPKDIEQAKYWWKKAAAQGNENAKEALQKIY